MHDVCQQGLQALATHNGLTRGIAIFCASMLVYALVVLWIVAMAWRRLYLTAAVVARVLALALLAYLLSKVLTSILIDPRPYVVTHTQPRIAVARDNGFPSDHTLLVAALAAAFWWIDRRLLALFVAATALVMLGRLAVGAHHTIDVVGSVAIVAVATLATHALPLPPR